MTARPLYKSTFPYPSTSAAPDALAMRNVLLPSPTPSTSSPADLEMTLAIDRLALKFSRLSLIDPPVRRIPDDLLYELFVLLVGDPSAQSCDLAVRLSHVCQDWRSMLVQAPLFWRFVTLHGSGSGRDHSPVVDSFLRRSQNLKIAFSLYLRGIDFWTDAFTQTLHPHAHRFHTLRVFASDFLSLRSHLFHVSSLSFTSLQQHEAFVRSDRVSGTITAVSCLSDTKMPLSKPLSTWPSPLALTAISFMYPSLNLSDIFDIVQTAQSTLQHLRLYFQCRRDPDILPQNRWVFSDGPPIHLRQLRSLALGYHDELALVPFLDCLRLPSLEALSLQNFALSRDPDIPKGQLYKLFMQSIPPIQPMPLLLSTLLDTLSAPHLLRSLRLIGLSWSEDTDPTDIFDRLGPYLRSLHIVHCPSDFLPELAEAMLASTSPWQLERLSVRGVDGDDLLHCLRIRRAQEYPPLKELSLVPCSRTPPRETLEQFAEVVTMLDLSTYF
ncbi:hypothetical protein C8R47DRAFT_1190007 [Mycena vitilis]|nr:hypothetical protein C8R47DRAFT_1190007 [Mycena vitilis]